VIRVFGTDGGGVAKDIFGLGVDMVEGVEFERRTFRRREGVWKNGTGQGVDVRT
jgi:hypothetical protein